MKYIHKTMSGIMAGLFLMTIGTSQAQVLPKMGLKAGFNVSTLNNVDTAENKSGFVGGVYVHISLPGSPIAIQPELLYAQFGSRADDKRTYAVFTFDYLQIPVLAKFGINKPGAPEVFAGPYVAYNMSADLDTASNPPEIKINDSIEKMDMGLVVGLGLSEAKFNVELRYTAGLKKVFSDPLFNQEAKNRALSLSIGVDF